MISTRTLDLIDRLKKAPWFEDVGSVLSDESVVRVGTWGDATRLALSLEWENARLDASNELSGFLAREHLARFRIWNKIVDNINERLAPVIEDVALRVIRREALPSRLVQVLTYTTCMACVEAEYADLVPRDLHSRIADWYLKGRFPCGLTDKYPKGQLMIF